MENQQPSLKFTDEDLRERLLRGLKPADIAREFGCSRSAVTQRVKRLDLTTASATHAPEESRRYVKNSIDAMEQLTRGLGRVNLLMDACHAWLQDAHDPDKYDLGPRSGEIDITYEVEKDTGDRLVILKRKKTLAELMWCLKDGRDEDGARFVGVQKGEYRTADPRELTLKTVAEGRMIVGAAADLAKMLADSQRIQDFQDALLEAIGSVAPDVARHIAEAVRRKLVLRAALGEPPALVTGDHARAD
jgi:hypothetical protein